MRLPKPRMAALVVGLAGLALVLPVGPAFAKRVVVCESAGQTSITTSNGGASYDWSIAGGGACVGGAQGVLTVEFTGQGSSATLGICSGHGIVQGLDITVNLLFTNHKTGTTTPITEHWVAGITFYPTITPFHVELTPHASSGVGFLSDHIYAILDPLDDLLGRTPTCPPGGAPSTTFAWVQVLPNL